MAEQTPEEKRAEQERRDRIKTKRDQQAVNASVRTSILKRLGGRR